MLFHGLIYQIQCCFSSLTSIILLVCNGGLKRDFTRKPIFRYMRFSTGPNGIFRKTDITDISSTFWHSNARTNAQYTHLKDQRCLSYLGVALSWGMESHRFKGPMNVLDWRLKQQIVSDSVNTYTRSVFAKALKDSFGLGDDTRKR